MRQLISGAACIAVIAGGLAHSQEGGGPTFTYNFPKGATVFTVTGAPYSGHMSSQSRRTLANGTHLTQPGFDQPTTYRDAMGRTRTDAAMQRVGNSNTPQVQRLAEITDPVAGYRYVLDDVHKVAYRGVIQVRQVPTANRANPARVSAPVTLPMENPKGATMTTEQLGAQTIAGIEAIGQRNTTNYPAGTYEGNDGPVSTVNESWQSVEYGLVMLSKNIGPEMETTTTMKDFSRAAPDPALFQVPAGYQIVDETGEFTITIPRGGK